MSGAGAAPLEAEIAPLGQVRDDELPAVRFVHVFDPQSLARQAARLCPVDEGSGRMVVKAEAEGLAAGEVAIDAE